MVRSFLISRDAVAQLFVAVCRETVLARWSAVCVPRLNVQLYAAPSRQSARSFHQIGSVQSAAASK